MEKRAYNMTCLHSCLVFHLQLSKHPSQKSKFCNIKKLTTLDLCHLANQFCHYFLYGVNSLINLGKSTLNWKQKKIQQLAPRDME